MLTREENHLVTQTGPSMPAGNLLRRFWQPAALTEELPAERPVKPLRLFGEGLILFQNEQGQYGLLGRHCSHRGADLSVGRLEDGGLRCLYHGWLYYACGQCLEQPAEPEGSRFYEKIRQPAYPCREINGIVFAYMGPGEPLPLPDFDCFLAPEAFTFAFKGFMECNWLQTLEVGIDPSHVSFLHRFFVDEEPQHGYGQQFREELAATSLPLTKILRDHPRPKIEVTSTDYGLQLYALRELDKSNMHIRVTNLVFPNAIAVPMGNDMVIMQWHVPIDDQHSWWYDIFYSFANRMDQATMRQQRLALYTRPDYKPRRNRSNNYLYDPQEQKTLTYTGMGMGIDSNVHDAWAVESAGPIQDRTVEHLGAADKGIIAYRKMLMEAIHNVQRGKEPSTAIELTEKDGFRGPVAIDVIGTSNQWEQTWKTCDLARREISEWASGL